MKQPLPCPWCGKLPTIAFRAEEQQTTGEWWTISCCRPLSDECPVMVYTGANNRAMAVARWNRRTDER